MEGGETENQRGSDSGIDVIFVDLLRINKRLSYFRK